MSSLKSSLFVDTLSKTIHGYHMINKNPIKESVWESILCQVFDRLVMDYNHKNGSHTSGQDIIIDDKTILSCKTCKETKNCMNISSYRLTKCKTIDEFIHEIDIVRANFTHYIILSRNENDKALSYNVYLIPSETIKAGMHEWDIKYKSNKDISVYKTNTVDGVQMTITPSMSNQLWIKLEKQHFKTYIIATIEIKNKDTIHDYCSLFDKLSISVSSSCSLFSQSST